MINDWKDGADNSAVMRKLLADVQRDMGRHANRCRSLRASRREEQKTSRPYSVDPASFQRQFDALVASGVSDIVIGYWRISTTNQQDGEGPESQQQSCIAFATANFPRGIDLWVFDIDSGKEESRSGLEFLRRTWQTKKVRAVVAQKLDRLARNNLLAEQLNSESFRAGVRLCSATEHLGEGAIGILMRQILQAFAQYEASLIVWRMNQGKRSRVRREGTYNGGEVPYGYLAAGKGHLVICEPEARIVQLIFALFEQGYAQEQIASALNRWGIDTRLGGKLGWRQSQIRRILERESGYRAETLFSKTILDSEKIAHQPILESRPVEQRTYLLGNVVVRRRVAVPDDLMLNKSVAKRIPGTASDLTAEQAKTLKTLFELRRQGLSNRAVTDELNRRGLTTPTGLRWKLTNTATWSRREAVLSPRIAAMGILTGVSEPHLCPIEREAAGVARILELRSQRLSYHAIRAQLIAEDMMTGRGAQWSVSSIQRVLTGQLRQSLKAAA